MNRSRRLAALFVPLAAAGALALTACSPTPAADPTTSAPAPETSAPASPSAEESASPSDDASAPASSEAEARIAAATAAIAAAEAAAGGTAFEIDTDFDRWEVSVAVGADEVEVRVSTDGTVVEDSAVTDRLDDDDRAAIEAGGVSITEAIEEAAGQRPGARLEGASLDEDDDVWSWEVDFDDAEDVRVAR